MSFVNAVTSTTESNLQSFKDFWLFVVYCLVVIVVVIFFLFYFNRVLGQVLTFLINQYTWRRYNAYIEVDSIRVSLLGGRILFKNLRYLSTNQSVSILKGHITLRYWLLNVRKSDDDKNGKTSNLPCRVVCSVEGFEWFFYNNAPAYNRMRDILGLSPMDSNSTSTSSSLSTEQEKLNYSNNNNNRDPESQTPTLQDSTTNSLMERLIPLQFECTTGAVMIGNTDIKSMLVCKVSQASGIYSLTKSRSSMDYYKSVIDFVLRKPQILLKDNMDYTAVVEEETIDRVITPLPRIEFVWWLLRPFRCLFPFASTRQYGKMQHMRDVMGNGRSQTRHNSENASYHEEYARVSNIVECNEMAITYYSDYAGSVPISEASDASYSAGIGIDIGNGGLPPEWGIRISLWDATIHYGPWADRQRSEMQDYFFPNSHRGNTPTVKLIPGQQRMPIAFETYIEFINEGKLRIPTREKSKDWKYTSGLSDLDIGSDGYFTRPYGWFNIKAGEGSYIKVTTPYVVGPNGYTNIVDVVLKDTDITTSVNYASFVQSNRIELRIEMPTPLQWNGYRHWDFKITPKKPTIFLLRDHVYLLQDMIKDWTSSPPTDLLQFTPMTYTLAFILENPTIYLCVNEHNVINNPNSIEDNAFLKLQGRRLSISVTLPFTEFKSETTAIKFFVEAEHGSAGLSLQTSHTLSAFTRPDDAHAAVAINLTIDGSYEYYSTVDILNHIESCNLHIKINGATVKLFGTLIRYIFLLKDNYFGAWNNFSTIDEYRQRKSNQQEWLEQKRRQAESKPLADPFEVYVLLELEDGVLLLPENLYECSRYSQFEFQELQLELRNLDVYLDMYLNISPITLSRDDSPSPNPPHNQQQQQSTGFFRIKNVRDPKNYVYIDGVNVYGHRLFGPLPACSTYLCHWEFDIGRITGEVKPSFLLGLSCFGQSFAYNLIDEDNAVPQEMESKTLPDVTFLKLYVREVDVYLMSMNSATNIRLQNGILLEFDNLINAKYSQRITMKIPAILTRCLANPDQARGDYSIEENEYSWVEVAKADLGLNITVFRHTAVWKKKRAEQQNFIRTQDYPTRRCVRLYEETDSASQASQSSMRSTNNGHHVGVLYAPPFRLFMFGRVEDKSVLYDGSISTPVSSEHQDRFVNSHPGSIVNIASLGDLLHSSDSSEEGDDNDDLSYDGYSVHSTLSRDNESFHTAKSEDIVDNNDDDYSLLSQDEESSHFTSGSSHDGSSSEQQQEYSSKKMPEKNLTAAIPPSIPYSDYLRRFKVSRPDHDFRHGGFFYPFIPPSQLHFIPEKGSEEKGRPLYENDKEDGTDYFSGEYDNHEYSDTFSDDNDAYGKGNEVIATTVIEATRPVNVLVTPILVKIVQELAEEIIKDDWDLETMLDALQMEYIEQLTRYLTDQYICTRFAVILPETYLHFIQNVTMPDNLPSYKHEDGNESFVKTQYNTEDTILCSADIFLNDFRMIGSVKFEDYAFAEKKTKVAESNLVLQESRVHIDMGDMGATVQYVSKQYERQSIVFGIPYESLINKELYATNLDSGEGALVDELFMLDLAVKDFSFKWLGAKTPNYFEMTIKGIDSIIITESVEILVGAVYSWLVFVDDLKGILESFRDQRTRQVQVFINEIANFSTTPHVVGDPVFLTTPTTMLRLGSRNFRNDCGWKLLARMRHCLRSMPSSKREELQYRLTSGNSLQDMNSNVMYESVIMTFSRWRSWEVGYEDITHCRLFTQPFNQSSMPIGGMQVENGNMTDKVVQFLSSSANFAKIRLGQFKFTIYEEEMVESSKEENSITISPFEFLFEWLFKSSPINAVPENTTDRKSFSMLDGYLDIIIKISIGGIDISVNPIILAFARHMLLVQRVFTAKLISLQHATKLHKSSNNNLSHISHESQVASVSNPPLDNSEGGNKFSFDDLLSKVDVVAQVLMNLDRIQVTAHAHELHMDATISGTRGSALFSNPKLAPLQLLSSHSPVDRDSDTGSGKRSSNRRRNGGHSEPRLVLEAAGGINLIDIKVKEEMHRNNTQIYSILLAVLFEKANVNANLSQITKISKKHNNKSNEVSKNILNVFSNIHRFRVHAPQSLLRLYGFVESWQTEQGRRYHFMLQNLVKEWEEKRREQQQQQAFSGASSTAPSIHPTTANKKIDIKLQFLLNELLIQADLLPSLSVNYSIMDFFIMVNESHHKSLMPVRMYAFQLTKQEVHLISKDHSKGEMAPTPKQNSNNTSTFSIPGIRSTGSLQAEMVNGVEQLKLKSMISVDLISMSLDVSLIDSLLTAHSLMGNEVSELVEVLSYSKRSKNTATHVPSKESLTQVPNRIFKYTVDVSLDGMRISASSPSAIGLFQSKILEASISNDYGKNDSEQQLAWKVQGRNFSLSLDHNTANYLMPQDETVYRRNCLAYILVDFSVQNFLPLCTKLGCRKDTHTHGKNSTDDALFIEFSRIQTVMQPIALGKLAEMYIYYDTELWNKRLMKKDEIEQLSANTKRIVQSIIKKDDWPKTLQEEPQSLLKNKVINLQIHRLGVAIPLDENHQSGPFQTASRGAGALLLSIASIEFLTKNIEQSALQLDTVALQFVKRFDQDKADHFVAENHPRMNQIRVPLVSCHVSTTNAKPVQTVQVEAQVGGFEVDVDGTIADYINNLGVIYIKSMDRVDAFSTKSKTSIKTPSSSQPSSSEIVHLGINCKFECDSGTIRMYPKRHATEAQESNNVNNSKSNKKKSKLLRVRTVLDPKSGDGNMALVEVPGLSAWFVYQVPLGAHAAVIDSPKRFHADILIRESKNTLHPALVQFLREVVAGLKLGMQQTSKRKADRCSAAAAEMTATKTAAEESNLDASLFLRLSKTQLDLSCQPTSKVVCSLGWEESEFLMNAFSKDRTSRTMSCVGSIRKITAVVKHHFSPEACLHASVDHILFNAMLTSQREEGHSKDDISILVELPHILGDINMRHLQDLLILNSCWFGQPILSESREESSSSNLNTPESSTFRKVENGLPIVIVEDKSSIAGQQISLQNHPTPFSKHIAVWIKKMHFSVDLGQSIGKITLLPNSLTFQVYHVPYETKGLCLSLDEVKFIAEGRLSGSANFGKLIVQARVQQLLEEGSILNRQEKSTICVRSNGFKAAFEYEFQNILDAIQQPLELNVDLRRIDDKYELDLLINLEALIARLSIKTVPVIITMVQRFNELLEKKKTEAGIRFNPLNSDKSSKSSLVPPSSGPKSKKIYENASVHSNVTLSVKAIEVVIYPSQFQDSDNVDIRAKQFRIGLEKLPRTAEGVHRKLTVTLASAALAKNAPGKELMVRYSAPLPPPDIKVKNLGGTKIFGIPGTEVTMASTQLDININHEFGALFAGRISVSLNIGLIKYLQEMINMFNTQLKRTLERNQDPFLATTSAFSGDLSTPVSLMSEEAEEDADRSKPSFDASTPNELLDSATSTPGIEQFPTSETTDLQVDDKEEKYIYRSIGSVNFQPQLQVMGDATPPVEWLGLKRDRIPGLVHENITLHLDQLAKVIWEMLESQID
ncbi:MAG: hypothetical protein EXX96DRAFT_506047 [Benjaminiella poitrasii]|nr:MAG: hypothetical protein EXX96DRAFT_506047 [Benjaminiella poitrasii]